MLEYIEYFGIPAGVALVLAGIFFILQLLETKGKVSPEISKIFGYFKQKKKERIALSKLPDFMDKYGIMSDTLADVQVFLKDVKEHYSEDNITKRDGWMKGVNEKFEDLYSRQAERDAMDVLLNEKIDKNNEITLALAIDNKRDYIINFASKAADLSCPVTREQYKRFFKVHKEYEELIAENNATNGEVDVAYRIAVESYEERLKKHAFLEDIRGYEM